MRRRVPAADQDDVIVCAQRDHNRERAAVMIHSQTCRYCIPTPCPMGKSVRENAAAYGRHLAMLAIDAAVAEGVAWA